MVGGWECGVRYTDVEVGGQTGFPGSLESGEVIKHKVFHHVAVTALISADLNSPQNA